MSRINFETLIAERPELINAFGSISAWLDKRPNVRFVEVPRIARELKYVPALELIAAFDELVKHGLASRKFQIEDPNGDLAEGSYEHVSEAYKARPRTRNMIPFNVEDGKVVSGFVLKD